MDLDEAAGVQVIYQTLVVVQGVAQHSASPTHQTTEAVNLFRRAGAAFKPEP